MVRLTKLLVVMAALFSTPAIADFYSHRYFGIGFLDSETDGYCTEANAFINSFQSAEQSVTATGGEGLFSITGQDGETIEMTIPVSGNFRDNTSGIHWGYGAGLSYRYNNSWSIRAEWEFFPEIGSEELRGVRDVETASLSWAMHF
ncbi:hypothetical protein PVT68_09280 [Microbulbifer bruguierae]|uniref:Outer membrane protein beta-barrel domain-containing protein n=1 Tax=Microbulbifer bruguierae TaxID=3029061 RepID=A0ABY8NJG2_9GAMM|nr:hypothetical protein [Microbulbifer bruguierae]WGL18474.1 hypothetical protein PVT68_09280 [Microbulbifer bruguierae]